MPTKVPLLRSDPLEISAYRLRGRLGEGGMGVVYLAQAADGQLVAVKVIRDHLAEDSDFRARFRSEVANASKVPRFCTAPILDADTEADPPYIVTEYIDGPTLTSVVEEHGSLPASQLHALGVGIASALGAIHHAGVIHRDLKPGNVLLSRFGPQVIDFGIARAVDAVTHLTQPGRVMGSPSFMAPEQLRGLEVTPKADIFAWGAIMSYAGTASDPFGTTTDAVYYQVLYGQPDLDGMHPDLVEIVARTLSKDPDERPDASELLDILVRSGGLTAGKSSQWQLPGAARTPAAAKVDAGTDGEDAIVRPPVGPAAAPKPVVPVPVAAPTPQGRRAERVSRQSRRRAGHARRLTAWIAAGLAVIALAYGTVCYLNFRAGRDSSAAAVTHYLDDVSSGRFSQAYDLLCPDTRATLTKQQFVDRGLTGPHVISFTVDRGSVPFTLSSSYTIAAQVRRTDGVESRQSYVVQPGVARGALDVCPR